MCLKLIHVLLKLGNPTLNGAAFNKIECTDSKTLDQAQQTYPDAIFISATERLGLETLRQRLVQLIDAMTSK